jgi:hypothetical protein
MGGSEWGVSVGSQQQWRGLDMPRVGLCGSLTYYSTLMPMAVHTAAVRSVLDRLLYAVQVCRQGGWPG